ncbi:BPI fold-containing family B member 2-like [Microcaecilia unicolor]|uniref:BPI fold-containing family B member 2-like n=1 Tax=Microcaecilia unicolor TaxID=1415580 RepID=A0A6P7YWK2_9AMPH|nr:BPI fold-containing family B member 2-like [Microcaecilia unicolor]
MTVSNVFIGLNAELGLLGAITPVDDQVNLQYIMPSQPVITNDYMDMYMDAQYTVNDQLINLPDSTKDFFLPPDAGNSDSMVNIAFSQQYFQSMYRAMQSSGSFNTAITHEMLPEQLTVAALGSYIPEVAKQYPPSSPLQVKFSVDKSPEVTLMTKNLVVNLHCSVDICVVCELSGGKSLLNFAMLAGGSG